MKHPRHRTRHALRHAALLLLTATLAGCVNTVSREVTFYTLATGAVSVSPAPARSTAIIAVGPVDFPDYLDRPQIVTRAGGQRLTMDEFHRWAGSLQEDTSRVVVQQLSHLLNSDQVFIYPSRLAIQPDYRLALNVRRFDGELRGEVVLDAAWSLVDGRSNRILDSGQRRYAATVAQPDFDAYVGALSTVLAALSQDIAAAVNRQGQ